MRPIKKIPPVITIKNYIKNKTYYTIMHEYPKLTQLLIQDLLKIEGYSEIEIGFGSGVNLDIIRKIIVGNFKNLSFSTFFKILGLYSKVFCHFIRHSE